MNNHKSWGGEAGKSGQVGRESAAPAIQRIEGAVLDPLAQPGATSVDSQTPGRATDAAYLSFVKASIEGVYLLDSQSRTDRRGSFTRFWCRRQFEEKGLATNLVQLSLSRTLKRGTLRGLHYQREPYAEVKVVRCVRGAIFDVILDLRRDSPTFCHHFSIVLTPDSNRAVYIPKGCAHGFQVLEDNSEVLYHMSDYYNCEAASGMAWDDPAFGIEWPIPDPYLSERDRAYPHLDLGA
jgi:dTDP-4-dehydrorhamnose 3,5-epimerase